ncbi:MAG TPA: hypothetical protein VJM46_01200 [Candidatus Saccharimonadales bacterium]|nr:hypothetical protein [Candidatus Saccharimonadales bacterium]
MFRSRITRLLVVGAAALAFGTACAAPGGSSGSTDTTASSSAAPEDDVVQGAAKIAVDLMKPQVQSYLTSLGFTSVTVDSEMEGGKAIVWATVSLPQLTSGCKLEYETEATNLKVYFDEVITPEKPAGVEVKGAARNTVSPLSAFNYVLANHPKCLVPKAKAPAK